MRPRFVRESLLSVAFALMVVVVGGAVGHPDMAEAAPEDVGDLPAVEIREYEGLNLSSINDSRENSINGPQHVDVSQYTLTVTGLVENEQSYSYNDVIDNHETYRKVVTLSCVEGWDVTLLWEGILVKDLLNEAGVRPEATTVIFKAEDGYSTTLPIEYIMDGDILLAYRMNGVTLPPERGFPFQLVAESKWGYKWIKWVTGIELSNNPNIQGYWEYYGYSESGDLDKPYFD